MDEVRATLETMPTSEIVMCVISILISVFWLCVILYGTYHWLHKLYIRSKVTEVRVPPATASLSGVVVTGGSVRIVARGGVGRVVWIDGIVTSVHDKHDFKLNKADPEYSWIVRELE